MRFALHAPRGFLQFVFAFLLITLMALAMAECPSLAGPGRVIALEASAPRDADVMLVVMPRGDPAAGRLAFEALSCHACHAVPRDSTLPVPQEKSGPDLGVRKGTYSKGYEITSILSPSHIVAFQYAQKEHSSHMPDLTANMSVKQLIDILAYLRTVSRR